MNFGKNRSRKLSVCEANAPNLVEVDDFPQRSVRRSRGFHQGKHSDHRDRDFFAPEEVEEWVLPEYRSLFHHLFLKEDDELLEQGTVSQNHPITSSRNISLVNATRRRKISPSGSTASSTASDDEGPLCNLVKSLPSWFKKVFHIQDNNDLQHQAEEMDRHAWLDEIPIEICDKLRHIHIYV